MISYVPINLTNRDVPVLSLTSLDDANLSGSSVPHPVLDLSGILASSCELANNRASKILGVRSEQHAHLPLPEFVELFKENWDFVIATETIARRMIVHLRGVTAVQVSVNQPSDGSD
jgi:vacuolar protein sorting-associated protein 54